MMAPLRSLEHLHHIEDMSLERRTVVGKTRTPKFRVSFAHCGTNWWWDYVVKPASLRCMCQKCAAFGVGRLEEIGKEKTHA